MRNSPPSCRGAEAISATLLAALFLTFLVQIVSRLVMQTPFGWTLELSLILWVWLVFFTAAFTLGERDHIRFDVFTRAAPRRLRRRLALVCAATIAVAMAWAVVPSWDYIDFLAIRKTATVRNPVTGAGIPMRSVFSVFAVFLLALAARYGWRAACLLQADLRGDGADDPLDATIGDDGA